MMRHRRQWSRSELIEELRKCSSDGRSIKFELERTDTSFEDAVYEEFGGWRKAFVEAGLNPKTKLLNYWTEKEVVKRIKQISTRGEPLNTLYLEVNHPRLWNAARRLFENIENAVAAAGIRYSQVKKRQSWSEEKIVDNIKNMYEQGRDISQISLMNDDSKLLAAGQKFFGSWRCAVEAAGIDYSKVKERRKIFKNSNS